MLFIVVNTNHVLKSRNSKWKFEYVSPQPENSLAKFVEHVFVMEKLKYYSFLKILYFSRKKRMNSPQGADYTDSFDLLMNS